MFHFYTCALCIFDQNISLHDLFSQIRFCDMGFSYKITFILHLTFRLSINLNTNATWEPWSLMVDAGNVVASNPLDPLLKQGGFLFSISSSRPHLSHVWKWGRKGGKVPEKWQRRDRPFRCFQGTSSGVQDWAEVAMGWAASTAVLAVIKALKRVSK